MNINLFEEVKRLIDIKSVVLYYGLKLNSNNMACCPFHEDKTPSFKVNTEGYFYCFGCGVKGDSITFVEKMFSLSPIEAIKKLNNDFCLNINLYPKYQNKNNLKKPIIHTENIERDFKDWEEYAYNVLTDYFKMLKDWKYQYAPLHENNFNIQFIESINNYDKIDYYCEILRLGSLKDKMLFFLNAENEVDKIAERITRYKRRNQKQSE